MLNERLTTLERKIEYLEARVKNNHYYFFCLFFFFLLGFVCDIRFCVVYYVNIMYVSIMKKFASPVLARIILHESFV